MRVGEYFFSDLWNDPLTATSRTKDKLGHIDFGMVIPPFRAFVYYTICPILAYPIACLHVYGYYRCLKTTVGPKLYRGKKYEDDKVYYGVQRRSFDQRLKKLTELYVDNPTEIQHALEITKGVRNQFVDDPSKPGQAYFVVEQKVFRLEAMFTVENWGYAVVSDVMRFLVPAALALFFRAPTQRMFVDTKLCLQGRMHWRQIRHPVLNFFSTFQEYNVATRRVIVAQPKKPTKPRSPWV